MDYGGISSKIPNSIKSARIGIYNTSFSFLCFTNKTKFYQPLTHEELINIKS